MSAALDVDSVNWGQGTFRGCYVYSTMRQTLTYMADDGLRPNQLDLGAGWNLVTFPTPAFVSAGGLAVFERGQPVPLESVLLPTFYENKAEGCFPVDLAAGTAVTAGRPYWVYAARPCQICWSESGTGPAGPPGPMGPTGPPGPTGRTGSPAPRALQA